MTANNPDKKPPNTNSNHRENWSASISAAVAFALTVYIIMNIAYPYSLLRPFQTDGIYPFEKGSVSYYLVVQNPSNNESAGTLICTDSDQHGLDRLCKVRLTNSGGYTNQVEI